MQSLELPNTLLFREIVRKFVAMKQYTIVQTFTDFDRSARGVQRKRYVCFEIEVNNVLAQEIVDDVNFMLERLGFDPNARIGKRGCNPNIKNDRTYIRGTCHKSRMQKERIKYLCQD